MATKQELLRIAKLIRAIKPNTEVVHRGGEKSPFGAITLVALCNSAGIASFPCRVFNQNAWKDVTCLKCIAKKKW